MTGFQCPPDCGYCCTHLHRDAPKEELAAERAFRRELATLGVYHCTDAPRTGLSLSPEEAAALGAEAARRGLRTKLHPRVWLLESRRREAVVLEWHLPHEVCPFYADFKCTAYEARPLLCRAYPVMGTPPAWKLAPECPLAEPTLADARAGSLKLGLHLKVESRARREVEKRHAALDERTMRLLATAGARFLEGLDLAEAKRRLARYAWRSPAEFEARAKAR